VLGGGSRRRSGNGWNQPWRGVDGGELGAGKFALRKGIFHFALQISPYMWILKLGCILIPEQYNIGH
jgi:hypothetical protein